MNCIKEKIKRIIKETLSVEDSEITSGAIFTDDLGADSLDMVELVVEVEREFGISIPDDYIRKILTVADLENYISGILK